MKRLILLVPALVFAFSALAVGEWTDYLSYSSAKKVILAGDKVYCVTTGGLFAFDQTDNSLQKLTGVNGLSDVGVSTVGYNPDADVVVVAYKNSNLDLLFEDEVFNLSDIKRKQISGDKTVYNLLFVGQTAYLSCGFGVVAVNLEKREIKDTYYIGSNGSSVKVMDMAFDGQYLYAATDEGLFKADINSANLQDFHNWMKDETIVHPDGPFDQVEYFNGDLIVNYNGGTSGGDELYHNSNGSWSRYLLTLGNICDLQVSAGHLVVACLNKVDVYDSSSDLIGQVVKYPLPSFTVDPIHANSAVFDESGTIWIADDRYALVREQSGSYESMKPTGPADNVVFSLLANGTDLWLASGGRTASWNNMFTVPQFQLYRDGEWKAFNRRTNSELNEFHDIVCITADPHDPDHVFAGSWGGGIVEFQGNQFVNRYNQSNSSLQSALPDNSDPYVRISDMDFDSQGNLWVTNSIVGKPLSVLRTNGEWEAFSLPGVQSNYDVGSMVITEDDDQWIVLPRGRNLVVRKADGSASVRLSLVAYFNNGKNEQFVPMSDIYSIALDRNGAVWLGTSVGVAVYYNPEDIWGASEFYASQPGLDLNDGFYHPLLSTETVTAIAVDGANRKWFGTKGSGLYLISENGEQEIEHFTSSNSPLLSDEITSLAINDKTGEVFIGTAEGLISYMGEATVGGGDFAEVYAYPNPVREDYDGDIVISGLMEDTDVKITDISGNLVFETKSLGGQAIWNGKNLNGKRPATGVYMVFGNDRTGEKTFVTKILFIH